MSASDRATAFIGNHDPAGIARVSTDENSLLQSLQRC